MSSSLNQMSKANTNHNLAEEDLLMSEKMSAMYKAKSNMIESILYSQDDILVSAYIDYKDGDLTLDEFIVQLVKQCDGEMFKNTIFTYMLSIIAVNEEKSRVDMKRTYIVD